MGWLISLIVGAIAGWIAGEIMKCPGSWLRNTALGIVGGMVGHTVLGIIGIYGHGFIGNIVVSVIGACILIWLVNSLVRR